MTDALGIAMMLSKQEAAVVRAAGDEFAKFPRAMGVTAVNFCRNRFKLIEAEDPERAVWNYRLTDLGREVKMILGDAP